MSSAPLKTTGLFLLLAAIFVCIGWLIGGAFGSGWGGMLFFLAIAALLNAIGYFYGDRLILRAYKARAASREEAPRLWMIVNSVAMKAQVPMPKIAIIPTATPNAFATGKNPSNATVAVTEGLQRMLGDDELEGVIAHEMAHIRSRDTLVMTTAATIAGAISYAARVAWYGMMFGRRGRGTNPLILLAAMVTAPIAALLIQLAISRTREYHADRVAALTTGKPWALARALERLEQGNQRPINGNPATSSLFIVNPFRGGFGRLFSTHPPTRERVKRLMSLSQQMGYMVK